MIDRHHSRQAGAALHRSRTWNVAARSALFVFVAVFGCSSDDSPVTPPLTTPEAGTDAVDSSPPEAASESGSEAAAETSAEAGPDAELVCEPQSVASFTPTWHPPAGKYQGLCAAGEAPAIIDACWGAGSSVAACAEAKTQHAACSACILSKDTDATWGAIIEYTELNFVDRNDAGCFALLQGDVSETGCGAKMEGYRGCVKASCGPVCEISDETFAADLEAYNTCGSAAANDPEFCQSRYSEFTECWGLSGFGLCKWKSNEPWSAVALRISELYCGVAPLDAGLDADTADAEADAETDAQLDATLDTSVDATQD